MLTLCVCVSTYVSLDMSERNGTDIDADSASDSFSKLGYKTKVFHNQTVKQMQRLLSDGNRNYTFSFIHLKFTPSYSIQLSSVKNVTVYKDYITCINH